MESLTACGKKTELPQIRLKADCAIGRARGRPHRESQRGLRCTHIHSLEARHSYRNGANVHDHGKGGRFLLERLAGGSASESSAAPTGRMFCDGLVPFGRTTGNNLEISGVI